MSFFRKFGSPADPCVLLTKTFKTLFAWLRLRLCCHGCILFLVCKHPDKSLHPCHQSLQDITRQKEKQKKRILKTDFSSDFKRSAQKLLVVVSLLKIERKIKKENHSKIFSRGEVHIHALFLA